MSNANVNFCSLVKQITFVTTGSHQLSSQIQPKTTARPLQLFLYLNVQGELNASTLSRMAQNVLNYGKQLIYIFNCQQLRSQ